MNYWVAVYRLAWGLLLVVLVVGVACIFIPKANRIREFQREKTARTEENRALHGKISDLKNKQEKIKSDPQFVERTAREMGMLKPNETVFKFTNKVSNASQL